MPHRHAAPLNAVTLSPIASFDGAAAGGPHHPAPVAVRLGHAGLLPFVVGAVLVWSVRGAPHAFIVQALSAYAALILSFLGGIHWGFGFRAPTVPASCVWGITPSLVGWVALLMQPAAGLVLEGALFVVCYLVDRRAYVAVGAAEWLTLRFRLSGIAALCCFLGAAGA